MLPVSRRKRVEGAVVFGGCTPRVRTRRGSRQTRRYLCTMEVLGVSSDKEAQMILVVGATGLVGNEVCQRLVSRGEAVRAFVRATSSPEKVESLRSSGVELCVGDLKDLQSVVAACRGVNAVISTASSTLTRQPGDSIQSV